MTIWKLICVWFAFWWGIATLAIIVFLTWGFIDFMRILW